MGDATNLAVDEIYCTERKKWILNGIPEPVLFITTELEMDEVQTPMVAFVSGVDEDKILDGDYTSEEEARVDKAIEIIAKSKIYIEYLPNFDIAEVERTIQRYVLNFGVKYVFFDYIHTSLKLLEEISQSSKGMRLREDNVLLMFITRLKDMCNSLGVFIFTSTQVKNVLFCYINEVKKLAKKIIITDEQKKDIATKYNNGATLDEIGELLKCTRPTARKILLEAGVALREKKSYSFNEGIFNSIDTEEKAYWLGFLYADGCVREEGNGIQIRLGIKDIQHLYKFRKFIQGNHRIKTYDNSVCEIVIYSATTKADLIKWGCTPRKTLNLSYPTFLKKDLERHFIRGYFDGDGTVYADYTRVDGSIGSLAFGIVGYKDFILPLYENLQLDTTIFPYGDDGVVSIRGFADTGRVLDYMYKDASIYLDRKKEYYDIEKQITKTNKTKS